MNHKRDGARNSNQDGVKWSSQVVSVYQELVALVEFISTTNIHGHGHARLSQPRSSIPVSARHDPTSFQLTPHRLTTNGHCLYTRRLIPDAGYPQSRSLRSHFRISSEDERISSYQREDGRCPRRARPPRHAEAAYNLLRWDMDGLLGQERVRSLHLRDDPVEVVAWSVGPYGVGDLETACSSLSATAASCTDTTMWKLPS
jgi:hypothetical protein